MSDSLAMNSQRLPDVIVLAQSCALFVLLTLYWIQKKRPPGVRLTIANSLLIPLRICFVHAIVFVSLLPFPGFIAASVPFMVVLALCILPFATMEFIPGGNSSAFSVGKMLMIPPYGLRQFVIGFPDRATLMHRQPGTASPLFDPQAALWAEENQDEHADGNLGSGRSATPRPHNS